MWGRYVGNGDRATAGQPGPGTLGDLRKPECRRDAVACLNHLITDALSLVPSCLEYLKRLEAGSDRVLRFCAIPQVGGDSDKLCNCITDRPPPPPLRHPCAHIILMC